MTDTATAGYGQHGDFLFHFTTADTAFRCILPTGQLLFRPYALMNDPLESRRWHFELEDVDAEALERLGDGTLKGLNLLRTNACLASFTVDARAGDGPLDAAFARGYARARMWEQYGDRHRGVCLCFTRRLEQVCGADSSSTRPVRSGAVRYTPAGLSGSPARVVDGRILNAVWAEVEQGIARYEAAGRDRRAFEHREMNAILDRMGDALSAHALKHLDDFLFLKTTDWESEHEHRIVIFRSSREDGTDLLVSYEDTLAAVIVGERFPEWQVPAALDACRSCEVDLLRMSWVEGIPAPQPVRA